MNAPGERSVSAGLAAALFLCHIICEAWTSSSEGFLVLALIAAAIAVRRHHLSVPFSPVYGPLALFVVGSILSAAFAHNPLSSLTEVSEIMTFLTFPLGLALYRRDEAMIGRVFAAFVFLAVMISVWGVFEYFVLGYDDLEHRISGPAAHVQTLSGILVGVSLLLFAHAWRRKSWLLGLALGLTMVTLVLTLTRGAWIGWLAGALVFVAVRRFRFVLYALPLLILGVVLSPSTVFDRAVSSVSVTQASNLDRLRMIEGGIEMIRDHPVVGVGPGNVKGLYPLYRAEDAPRFRLPHLHNNVIQIWAERGITALLGYLGLLAVLVALFLPAAIRQSVWAQGGLAVTAGLTVAGLFEFNFGDSEVMMTFLDLVGLSLAGMAGERIRTGEALLGGQTERAEGVADP